MKVYDLVELFLAQLFDHAVPVFLQHVYLVYIGIVLHDRAELGLDEEVNLGIRQLLFQAADNGSSEYDIADGTKTDHQEFHRAKVKGLFHAKAQREERRRS